MIDLHTHSHFSDGSDSPTELARNAASIGITTISLTDHDTTESHSEMAVACASEGLELIAGVEVSLKDPLSLGPDGVAINVHVLGYFMPTDPTSASQRLLVQLREDRERRNRELVGLLQSLGFTRLTLQYVVALARNVQSVGRPHFARAMCELHPEIVGNFSDGTVNQIFVDWLGKGGRAYLPKTELTIEEFTTACSLDGAICSIAHPLVNYVKGASRDEIATAMPNILHGLRSQGIRGVEAYYGSTDEETRSLMVTLGRRCGLVPTGGSDYHGSYKNDVTLGFGKSGDLRVPNEVLDELKALA